MLPRAVRRILAPPLGLLAGAPALAQAPPITTPVPLPAAEPEEEAPETRFIELGVSVFGTAGTFRMNEFNDEIRDLTAIVRDRWGVPYLELDRITRGTGYGAGIQAFVRGRFLVALDYERLTAASKAGGRLDRSDIRVPADAFLVTVGWAFYTNGAVRVGLAAGLGHYTSDGSAEFFEEEEVVERVSLEGSETGQHYVLFTESPLAGSLHVLAMAGYRRAKISDFDVKNELAPEPAGGDGETAVPELPYPIQGSALDWSGFLGRAGLVYRF